MRPLLYEIRSYLVQNQMSQFKSEHHWQTPPKLDYAGRKQKSEGRLNAWGSMHVRSKVMIRCSVVAFRGPKPPSPWTTVWSHTWSIGSSKHCPLTISQVRRLKSRLLDTAMFVSGHNHSPRMITKKHLARTGETIGKRCYSRLHKIPRHWLLYSTTEPMNGEPPDLSNLVMGSWDMKWNRDGGAQAQYGLWEF